MYDPNEYKKQENEKEQKENMVPPEREENAFVQEEHNESVQERHTEPDYTPEDIHPTYFEEESKQQMIDDAKRQESLMHEESVQGQEEMENTSAQKTAEPHFEMGKDNSQEWKHARMHHSGARKDGCYAEHIKKQKRRSGGWAKLIAGCLIVGIAGGASIGAGYGVVEQYYGDSTTVQNSGTTFVQQAGLGSTMSVVDVVREVKPSVVSITTKIEGMATYYGAFSVPYEGEGAGSGVIFYSDDDKIAIVTNNHVIEDAKEVYVTLNDTVSVQAKVVGTKSDSDLAVLTVSWDDLKTAGIDTVTVATFGDSDALEVGESVIAIGNAMGLGLSATDGIISVKDQVISVEDTTLNVIQTSAAINNGNSGGALVNTQGEVIGINTAKYNSTMAEGMGYAIPSNEVISVAQDLLEDGTVVTPYIGIMGTSITSENASLYKLPVGALIVEVTENGPAAQAGIQPGDIITEFNGKTVMDMDTLSELVKETVVGDSVSVHIIRNGETAMDVTLTIADKNA
ncbi:MAG TPA: trypsin-like peptidase domain-containing protein [Candidatus Anaerotignum merdipullorum]|nr:trypsin-like peptidase domain-containing protein [Candidatus Anaerotignum merdipullorum]